MTIPSTITSFSDHAFYASFALSQVLLTTGIKVIGRYMFSNSVSLKTIVVTSTVTLIGLLINNALKL